MSCQTTNPCVTQTVVLTNCDGCTYTTNTDCVIYNGDALPFESNAVNGSSRTLSDLLALITPSGSGRQSKIIEFTATDLSGTYTLVSEDVNKVLLLTFFDDLYTALVTDFTIILPNTMDFVDQEIIIKNIMVAVNPAATLNVKFNQAIQYGWFPSTQTSTSFATLDSSHGVVRLRYIKTTPTSYQWIIVD